MLLFSLKYANYFFKVVGLHHQSRKKNEFSIVVVRLRQREISALKKIRSGRPLDLREKVRG